MNKLEINKSKDLYILIWKFTILEDFILKILENKGSSSDEQIAEILCLDAEDIADIINDDGINKIVQGDSSRRTLKSDFIRGNLSIYEKDGTESQLQYSPNCYLKFCSKLPKLQDKEVPELLKKKSAKEYYKFNPSDLDNP